MNSQEIPPSAAPNKKKKVPPALKKLLSNMKKVIKDLDRKIKKESARGQALQEKIDKLTEIADKQAIFTFSLRTKRQRELQAIQLEAVKLRGDLDPIELGELLNTYLK